MRTSDFMTKEEYYLCPNCKDTQLVRNLEYPTMDMNPPLYCYECPKCQHTESLHSWSESSWNEMQRINV